MLDTIVYIPTILAYAFISLLIIILSFIVVYVGHRIYACIYDNLPVAHAALSTILSMDYKDDATHSGIALHAPASFNEHTSKSKTALRIIVTLAPSYLAQVTYENPHKSIRNPQQNKIIKYYDRLSQIPIVDTAGGTTRKLRQRMELSRRSATLNIPATATNIPIKSVATSTTRLSEPTIYEEEEDENAMSQQASNAQEVEHVSAVVERQSVAALRPAVTFMNAVNALANMKIRRGDEMS